MTERDQQLIAYAAQACERSLILASVYDRAGDLSAAAESYETAEAESAYAFAVAANWVTA